MSNASEENVRNPADRPDVRPNGGHDGAASASYPSGDNDVIVVAVADIPHGRAWSFIEDCNVLVIRRRTTATDLQVALTAAGVR